jgi:hypothetical protein
MLVRGNGNIEIFEPNLINPSYNIENTNKITLHVFGVCLALSK